MTQKQSEGATRGWKKRREPTLKDYLLARIYRKTKRGCWLVRTSHWSGYAIAWYEGKQKQMHIASYEVFVGKVPKGKILRHTCDVRNCINYDHIIPGTHKDNTRDYIERNPRARKNMLALAVKGTAAMKRKWDHMTKAEKAEHKRKQSKGIRKRLAKR